MQNLKQKSAAAKEAIAQLDAALAAEPDRADVATKRAQIEAEMEVRTPNAATRPDPRAPCG